MKVREAIERLQAIEAQHGDIPLSMPDGLEVQRLEASQDGHCVYVIDMDEDGNTKGVGLSEREWNEAFDPVRKRYAKDGLEFPEHLVAYNQ